jgi:hypothetical protein
MTFFLAVMALGRDIVPALAMFASSHGVEPELRFGNPNAHLLFPNCPGSQGIS